MLYSPLLTLPGHAHIHVRRASQRKPRRNKKILLCIVLKLALLPSCARNISTNLWTGPLAVKSSDFCETHRTQPGLTRWLLLRKFAEFANQSTFSRSVALCVASALRTT